MLLVNASLQPSAIHGIGCFTNEPIKKGQLVWVYDPRIDSRLPLEELPQLPPAAQKYCDIYGYTEVVDGQTVITLCGDHAKHMNHADDPNTIPDGDTNERDIAARDIAAGEELTSDYHTFDADIERRQWELGT